MIMILLRSLWKDDYPKGWNIIIELFSMMTMLLIFWYTAKVFVPVAGMKTSYFTYLVTSELILYLPLVLLQQNIRLGKKIARRGTFDFLFVRKVKMIRYFSIFSWTYFLKDFVKLLTLLCLSVFIFDYSISINQAFSFFIYTFFLSFLCSVIGMTIAFLLIFFGRGEGLWSQLISFSSILAGAYFPLKAFPEWLQQLSMYFNPLTLFLEYGRFILGGHFSYPPVLLFGWCLLIMGCCYVVYHMGLKRYRKKGPPADITF